MALCRARSRWTATMLAPRLLGGAYYPVSAPYWPTPTGEEELGFLKDQADVVKRQLEDIKSRIKELERKE